MPETSPTGPTLTTGSTVLTGHTVVFGDSRVAHAVARQRSALGPVLHAGREPVPDAVGLAATEYPVATDPEAAILATGAAAAACVVVDRASDAETLAVMAALIARADPARRPAILANLRDPALRRVVDDNLFAAGVSPRPRLIGTAALAAGAAIAASRPCDLAAWRGQARVHAVLIGFSTLGRACFEDLVLASYAGDLGKPRLVVVDPDPDSVRKRLARDMPEIGRSADVAVAAFDPLTLTADDGPLAAAEAVAPLTLIVLALEDAAAAMEVMTSLARLQEGEGRAVASVLVVTEAQGSLLDLARPAGRPRDLGRAWAVRGGVEDDPDILGLVTERADALAARIHETYRARFGGSGPASAAWDRLPETYRRANRRAAEHLPLKLWTLGLREMRGAEDPFAVDPHAFDNVVRPIAAGSSEDALVRRLSRIEHERWCAERRLDGWRHGDVRDDARRIHPKLVPFDDPRFTAEDIEKDADQVRFLFGQVVRPAPDGAVTPLVLGVVGGGQPTPGIDAAAAIRLCLAESWRPVVVVSGLLDTAECRLLAALAAALDRHGLAWRLVVPEVSRGNREVRIVPEPADQALLHGFLDRATTRFAPIRAAGEPADLWADPSAPDPHAAAIAAYVAARASALVEAPAAGPAAAA